MSYYSQRDKKWADDILGFGKTRLGTHGCFVTSLGNLCGKTPREVNHILQKGKFFNGDLIISTVAMAKSLGLEYAGKSDKQPKYRCIAEVDMSPAPGKQQHFVVIKEDGSIIDSWTGTIRPKGTYPIVSYRLFKVPGAPQVQKVIEKPVEPTVDPVKVIPEVVQEVNQPQEQPMLQGYRTYISLAVTLAAVFGLTKYIAPEDIEKILQSLVEVIGIASAAYFRYKATK